MLNYKVVLTMKPLDLASSIAFVSSETAGGLVHFVGTVRNHNKGKHVTKLEFEAFEPMAIKEMSKIAERCLEQFEIEKIAIYHRLGNLLIGEEPVIISVSAPHRKAAFDACSYAIDTLKETVPIWKKEFYDNGSVWISATP